MSKLIGTNPNQVPSNADLGTAAFADVKDFLSSKGSELEAINSVIQNTTDAVFVYDTTKDSDGGAWRKRTSHTSWYNEELNVHDYLYGSRGSRREFPALAIIVLERDGDGLCIFDGDDPSLPLWMSFPYYGVASQTWYGFGSSLPDTTPRSISAVNGTIAFGNAHSGNSSTGLTLIRFIQDDFFRYWLQSGGYNGNSLINISQRGKVGETLFDDDNTVFVDRQIYQVEMKVLPNAPIDPATKLPRPTIYLGEGGGLTIIRDDGVAIAGSEVNSTWSVRRFLIDKDYTVWGHEGSAYSALQLLSFYPYNSIYTIGSGNMGYQMTNQVGTSFGQNTDWPYAWPDRINGTYQQIATAGDNFALASQGGLGLLKDYAPDRSKSMVAFIHPGYNTGWLVGNAQVSLADIDNTSIYDQNLLSNPNFSSTDYWTLTGAIPSDWSISSGTLNIADTNRTGDNYAYQEVEALEDGEVYQITITWNLSVGDFDLRLGGSNRIFSIVNQFGSSGTRTFTLRASSSNNRFEIIANQHAVGSFDTVRLSKTVTNRTAYGYHNGTTGGNHLRTVGLINRTPVAPGAELVSYSGFNDSGNYMRATDFTVNYGAGVDTKICFMGWQKITTVSNYQYMTSTYDTSSGQVAGLSIMSSAAGSNTGRVYFYDGPSGSLIGDNRIDDGAWHFVVGYRDGLRRAIYVDGRLQVEEHGAASATFTTTTVHNVGHYTPDGTAFAYSHLGEIALVRILNSIPTSEQIRQIYEDERHMFRENAKVSILGTPWAPTFYEQIKDVSYDSDMDHLHVANGAGRSTFQRLCRVDEEAGSYSVVSGAKGLIIEG
jgi:hypothetical protein